MKLVICLFLKQARLSPPGWRIRKREEREKRKKTPRKYQIVDSSGLQDVVRLESQGPDKSVESGHRGREEEDAGELSVRGI